MAFLEKVFRKEEELNIEEFLNNLDVEEENVYEDATALVKPINLVRDLDVDVIVNELKQGNFLLLNIGELKKRNAVKLRELVDTIRSKVDELNGDLALVSHEKILVTPSKIKIVKKKA
ncbi:cell division protein SepF [Candidatus Micrarchaeota archaeon]|nr:cell division protein SepF [Candidatus Micrarchaeota archaeon]MBU1930021.1 cell division protein SepF [Candidatus Micrarchaeota archaeon]